MAERAVSLRPLERFAACRRLQMAWRRLAVLVLPRTIAAPASGTARDPRGGSLARKRVEERHHHRFPRQTVDRHDLPRSHGGRVSIIVTCVGRRDRMSNLTAMTPEGRTRKRTDSFGAARFTEEGVIAEHNSRPDFLTLGSPGRYSQNQMFHSTTILAVRHRDRAVLAGDGQVTFGATIVKQSARKIRASLQRSHPGRVCRLGGRLLRAVLRVSSPSSNSTAATSNGRRWSWRRTGAAIAFFVVSKPC